MKVSLIVFLVACFAVVFGQSLEEQGFIPGPGGALFHPDCHVGMLHIHFI